MRVAKVVVPLLSMAVFGALILTTGIESYFKPHRDGLIPSTVLEIKANRTTQASFTVPTGGKSFALTATCDDGVDTIMVGLLSKSKQAWFVPCGEEVSDATLDKYFTRAKPFTSAVRATPLRVHGRATTPVVAEVPAKDGEMIPHGLAFGGSWRLTLEARG